MRLSTKRRSIIWWLFCMSGFRYEYINCFGFCSYICLIYPFHNFLYFSSTLSCGFVFLQLHLHVFDVLCAIVIGSANGSEVSRCETGTEPQTYTHKFLSPLWTVGLLYFYAEYFMYINSPFLQYGLFNFQLLYNNNNNNNYNNKNDCN